MLKTETKNKLSSMGIYDIYDATIESQPFLGARFEVTDAFAVVIPDHIPHDFLTVKYTISQTETLIFSTETQRGYVFVCQDESQTKEVDPCVESLLHGKLPKI